VSALSSGTSLDISTLTNLFNQFDLTLSEHFNAVSNSWTGELA